MTVTFFGHADTPSSVRPMLLNLLETLIEKENADAFYIGHHGAFDALAASVIKELQNRHPNVRYFIVLSHMPHKKDISFFSAHNTILPEQVALALPRFAINERNIWMLENSDAVVTYVTHTCTNTAKWVEKARRMGKHVIPVCPNEK